MRSCVHGFALLGLMALHGGCHLIFPFDVVTSDAAVDAADLSPVDAPAEVAALDAVSFTTETAGGGVQVLLQRAVSNTNAGPPGLAWQVVDLAP